jgi:hypothetical protein
VREAVGGPTGGHWHVFIEQPGDYEFTLRRWPEQTKAALGDKYDVSPKSPSNKVNVKAVAFPTIAKAKLEIGGVQATAAADPQATAAVVIAKNLPRGQSILKAWFTDAADKDQCGAFFVTVRRRR